MHLQQSVMLLFDGGYSVEVQSEHSTMAECHVAATQIHWEERMPVNKELACMLIEETG